ncbi:MAG TPA: AMP-binding protein [Anaerolineales bacterium]|nr:AMP-binding protein [Anaerolineales bacterium]
MPDISTLIELLAHRAEVSGEKAAFTFQGIPTSYRTLWNNVNQFASKLFEQKIQKQECVVIALPNGPDFFFAFYGVQRAGGIAVPLFPDSSPDRIASVAKSCGARIVILPENSSKKSELESQELIVMDSVTLLANSQKQTNRIQNFPNIQPNDIAFLQYTSGSTGDPKGVMLTHTNLLTNIRQMIEGMEIMEEDVFVSWLPVYHDMGLIIMTMIPFYLAAEVHLLPASLRRLQDWFETIETVRGTFTATPDFALRLCVRQADMLREYDVTSLRVVLNAAEPVRATTITGFESVFGLVDVVAAGYGLAEATVGVGMWAPRTPMKVDANGLVAVGHLFPDVEVKIADDGEILIKSPANSKGYFNNEQATQKLYTEEGFIHSGDLGYLDGDGHLYILGRKKNIIKHAGETIAPQEIEETVDALEGVRYSAAVGIDRGRVEGEQAYVFVEMREQEDIARWGYELILKIVGAIHGRLGIRPARVYLVRPRTIPKTHNGKIQHVRLREMYLNGTLREQGLILYPDY